MGKVILNVSVLHSQWLYLKPEVMVLLKKQNDSAHLNRALTLAQLCDSQ